jgi:hypothetical protein
MGYYTYFELEVKSGNGWVQEYEDDLKEIVGYNPLHKDVKWYSCEKDMKEFSIKHPKTVFMLTGSGEENGDLWHAYFLNGKMQMCKAIITYDDFDHSKLQ